MKKTTLVDGSQIFCITPTEGQMLYEHISGYLEHDLINIEEGDTIIDVGANIGVFGIRLSKMFANIQIIGFEPIGEIFKVLTNQYTSVEFGAHLHVLPTDGYDKINEAYKDRPEVKEKIKWSRPDHIIERNENAKKKPKVSRIGFEPRKVSSVKEL